MGPEARGTPRVRFERGTRARGDAARHRRRLAGDWEHHRTREEARTTRTAVAHHLGTTPPSNGRRSAQRRRWRGGELPELRRTRKLTKPTLRDAIEREKWSGGSEISPRRRSGAQRGTGRLDGDAIGDEARRRSCGKPLMATKRLHPSLHGLARTERRSRRSFWWRRFSNGGSELRQWRIEARTAAR